MSTVTVAAGLALAFATSACLAYAGDVIRRRPLHGADRLAGILFAVWWYSASLVILNQAIRTVLVLVGVTRTPIYAVQGLLGMIPLAAAVWALTYYIVYLLSGRRAVLVPITLCYTLYLVFLFWFQVRSGVAAVELGRWQALVVAEHPAPAWATLVFGLWLAVPVLFAVAVYFVLAIREGDPTLRYRLSLVSAGFVQLFTIVLLGYLLGWVGEPWFSLAYQVPALLASMLAVAAYRPPGWVQRRFGVLPVPSAAARVE